MSSGRIEGQSAAEQSLAREVRTGKKEDFFSVKKGRGRRRAARYISFFPFLFLVLLLPRHRRRRTYFCPVGRQLPPLIPPPLIPIFSPPSVTVQ